MDEHFWHERWQKNEIGFHLDQPHHFLTRFFETMNLKEHSRVFVPMCGKSPDLLWIAEQGSPVIGVEISQLAIESFFVENNLNYEVTERDDLVIFSSPTCRLYCGDFFDLNASELADVDGVYDRGALVAQPYDMRCRYASKLADLLMPGCKVLLVSYDYNQQETFGPPFAVPVSEVQALFNAEFRIELLAREDVLWSHQALAARGVTQLDELALLLERRGNRGR
ncbi:MAG: thiopurine S-methyltransferase [Deltaproteobacteria bacterium]|jgi:thiopurine S-methyltransferase|nr:thiopurine S-methyltransferase [Deltaproteobacteria bacterium]